MTTATEMEKQIILDWNNKISTPTTDLFKKLGLRGKAEHFGIRQFSPSAEWAQYNRQKSYSKTDIKIDSYKISLKSANDHIMMSAKKNEALATFMCVSNQLYGNKIPDIITAATKEMERMITTGVSPTTITKAKRAGDEVIAGAQREHDRIIDRIENVFDDPTFISYFIKEVLSGELKFGKNSDGSATHILHITNRPILHSLDDMDFIGETASHVDIRIDFKSVKKTQGPEYGMYRYWSILQLISKELIKDSIMYEESFLSKSFSYVLSLLSDIKQKIRVYQFDKT